MAFLIKIQGDPAGQKGRHETRRSEIIGKMSIITTGASIEQNQWKVPGRIAHWPFDRSTLTFQR